MTVSCKRLSGVDSVRAMPDIRLTVDAAPYTVPDGSTAAEAFALAGVTDVIAVRINQLDPVRDLAVVPDDGDILESIPASSEEGRAVLRHSAAHVLAQAVQELFPGTRLGIGPPIENGFYYDFLPERPFTPEDLAGHREEDGARSSGSGSASAAARAQRRRGPRASSRDEPFKLELIGLEGRCRGQARRRRRERRGRRRRADDVRQPRRRRDRVWTDLCRGPHLPTTRDIPAFKLMRTAAAYWRGEREQPAAAAHLRHRLGVPRRAEGAPRRCSRRPSGATTASSAPSSTCSASPTRSAPGSPSSTPRAGWSSGRWRTTSGAGTSRRASPTSARRTSPRASLFETSGHLPYYADTMFPPHGGWRGRTTTSRPMNCPMHNLIYRSRGRSYRELPLRLFEFGSVYRYEKSGRRARPDPGARAHPGRLAHPTAPPSRRRARSRHLLRFVLGLLSDFGLDDFYLELSTRDDTKPDKFVGSDDDWAVATAVLRGRSRSPSGLELVPDPGGAAFYGPKIRVQARDAIGRTWQMSTIQYDFNQPKGFGLEYQAADGTRQQPVMIHSREVRLDRAVLRRARSSTTPARSRPGCRPCRWSASRCTDRARGLPAATSRAPLRAAGIRVEVDDSDDRMQKKIRNAQKQKVPYMLIAGDDDVERGRCRSATATAARTTASRSTRRSPRSSTVVRRVRSR